MTPEQKIDALETGVRELAANHQKAVDALNREVEKQAALIELLYDYAPDVVKDAGAAITQLHDDEG